MVLEKRRPVISLTLRHDREDNFWFCLLHELAHLQKHLHIDKTNIIIDEIQAQRTGAVQKDSKEKEADKYAQNALIPGKYWKEVNLDSKDLAKEVLYLSEKLKIHPAIIAGRIQYEKNNDKILSQFIGRGEVNRIFNSIQSK
jgi:HTH-type transcriptional regulator / antitoxin HigA